MYTLSICWSSSRQKLFPPLVHSSATLRYSMMPAMDSRFLLTQRFQMLSFLWMTFTHCSHYQLLVHSHSPFNLFLKNISSIFAFIIQFQESHTGIIIIPVYFIVPWAHRVVSMAKEPNPIPDQMRSSTPFFSEGMWGSSFIYECMFIQPPQQQTFF